MGESVTEQEEVTERKVCIKPILRGKSLTCCVASRIRDGM